MASPNRWAELEALRQELLRQVDAIDLEQEAIEDEAAAEWYRQREEANLDPESL